MVKLLAEIASLKEKVNSMGQNGPEAAPKGKTIMSRQQVKVTRESRPKMGTLSPKIPHHRSSSLELQSNCNLQVSLV